MTNNTELSSMNVYYGWASINRIRKHVAIKGIEGSLEKLLEVNYQADINNVPEAVLIEIKEALRKGFKHIDISIRYEAKNKA